MTYTSKNSKQLKTLKGTLLSKVAAEFALVDTEIDSVNTAVALAQTKFVTLSVTSGTNAAIATAGIDLASGSDIVGYAHFFPKAITIVKMHDYLTEAYAADTTAAKLEVWTEVASPVKLFTRTITAGGELIRAFHSTNPESGAANVAAGTAIYLKAVNTGASGTGHALVVVEYVER